MTKDYSAEHIRVLEEVEHIRLNPSMYIGSTDNPTHLIEEALDNALDEALAGYAKIIAVIIDTKKNIFSVLDSGRGIPISADTPITISSKLFSGAKFQDKKTAYEISSGLHGVGLVAVNALSSYYKVEIYRNNQHAIYEFKDMNLKTSVIKKHTGDTPFATKIEFKPDKKFFNSLSPNIDRIRKRLTTASAEMPDDINFILIIDEKEEIFKLSLDEYFRNNCLTSDGSFNVFDLKVSKEAESFHALFTYEEDGPITPKIFSSINLLPVEGGGTHAAAFFEMIRDFFILKSKKFGYKFQPNDSLMGLRAYLMLSMIDPKFSGQTKEKLTNRKSDFDKYMKTFRIEMETWAKQNENSLIKLLGRFQEYRNKLDAKKLKGNGAGNQRTSTKFTKLRDCISRLGELYIVEGDSAGGCFPGDTEVMLENGSKIKIETLINELKSGKSFNVLSFNNNLNHISNPVISGCLTKYTDEFVTIETESGYFTCTPDHLIRMKDGSYKEAQKLENGDDILSLGESFTKWG